MTFKSDPSAPERRRIEINLRKIVISMVMLLLPAIIISVWIQNGNFQECRAAANRSENIPPDLDSAIDFRYAPLQWQSCIAFTDFDSLKSLVGEHGELRYGYPETNEVLQLTVMGMEADRLLSQWIEAPGMPIVHTRLERPRADLELIAFATNRPGEGRVDNIILQVTTRSDTTLLVQPILAFYSKRDAVIPKQGERNRVLTGGTGGTLLAAASRPFISRYPDGKAWFYRLRAGEATADAPLCCFVRLPQEGQDYERIRAGLDSPWALLAETRDHWRRWRPVAGNVTWTLPQRLNDFLIAGACSMFQMREMKNGKPTIQAGPTVYRGFWVLDGHWIMEAIRYLGHDAEAQRLLEDEWAGQDASGGFFAGAGREHWKDTGIAIFSLIRHAELSQNWSFFIKMKPQVLRAVAFLASLRERARAEGGSLGRYGLLPKGFCDGGIDGIRAELTNTVWVLAGLKALAGVVEKQHLSGFDDALRLYRELLAAFRAAATQEMRLHPAAFQYLPMLLKEDPQWNEVEAWARPRPQGAQWALSQAIFPGLLFEPSDPIVQGHQALMAFCVQEHVPAETGWIQHGGLWNNQAAFQAQIHLWLRETELARRNFIGFLNHAAPVYVWREEQPLRGSTSARSQGDMPHISATSEMVRYLRHMLALEVDSELRLLQGIGDLELSTREPFAITESPTRFGRITLSLEPQNNGRTWNFKFDRRQGPAPAIVELPASLGSRLKFKAAQGAQYRIQGSRILVSPEAASWSATFSSR